MLPSRRLQLRILAVLLAISVFFLTNFNFQPKTSGSNSKNPVKTEISTKKPPAMYKKLNWEKRESQKRLNNIDDLIRTNLNKLPNRTSNLSASDLCAFPAACLPPLKFFEGEVRTAPRYNLSTCVVQKSMSTVMTSLFCYLRDEQKFVENGREILKDWKIVRFCMFKNEFRNIGGIYKKFRIKPETSNWTHIMLVRHPLERFVSGFVDKCYRKPVVPNFCNGCGRNLTCFMESELARMRKQVDDGRFLRTYEDRHFFPQNWRCNLHEYFHNFTFIKYSSSPNYSLPTHLFPILRSHKVPESSLSYLQTQLTSGRTAHTTVDSKAAKFIEKRLTKSPYLMELLVRMFYHDFVLFNFTLPAI